MITKDCELQDKQDFNNAKAPDLLYNNNWTNYFNDSGNHSVFRAC